MYTINRHLDHGQGQVWVVLETPEERALIDNIEQAILTDPLAITQARIELSYRFGRADNGFVEDNRAVLIRNDRLRSMNAWQRFWQSEALRPGRAKISHLALWHNVLDDQLTKGLSQRLLKGEIPLFRFKQYEQYSENQQDPNRIKPFIVTHIDSQFHEDDPYRDTEVFRQSGSNDSIEWQWTTDPVARQIYKFTSVDDRFKENMYGR